MARSRLSPFNVASLAHELGRRIAMTDALDILFDNRTFVEVGCHIMCCRADDLHPARMGLMIGLGAFEAGKETVMNIDAFAGKLRG